jgi:hypothetical protein
LSGTERKEKHNNSQASNGKLPKKKNLWSRSNSQHTIETDDLPANPTKTQESKDWEDLQGAKRNIRISMIRNQRRKRKQNRARKLKWEGNNKSPSSKKNTDTNVWGQTRNTKKKKKKKTLLYTLSNSAVTPNLFSDKSILFVLYYSLSLSSRFLVPLRIFCIKFPTYISLLRSWNTIKTQPF